MTKRILKENNDLKNRLISSVQEYWKEAYPMIGADAACPYSRAELEAMSIEELEGAVDEAREAYENSGDPHGDFSDEDYLDDDETNPRYYTDLDNAELADASMRMAAKEPYDPAEDLPSKSGMGRRVEGVSKSVLSIIVAEGAALKAAGLMEKCELNYDAIQEAMYDEMLRGEINEVEGTKEEIQSLIAAMDPNDVAEDEYYDSETGEVYLASGQKAGSSWMHPSYQKVQPLPMSLDDMDEEPAGAEHDLDAAIHDYVSGFEGESFDDPEGMAPDAADGFFALNPQWNTWATELGMTKADIKSHVAELISSSMMGEGLQLEAEYKGRDVPLGKPMKGDTAKFKVYVKDKKTGNVKKVNFGDKGMEIRRDNPKARKSFRARHGCGTKRASDRTKAAYWSCRMWSTKPVSKIVGGK
jgi:hypothetical protein